MPLSYSKFQFFIVSGIAFPACVINGTAVTKTFQILYRNEEVQLGDVVHFRIHGIVEGGKVKLDIINDFVLKNNVYFSLVIDYEKLINVYID